MWNYTKCCFQGTKSLYQKEFMQNNALICQDFVDFTINKDNDFIGALADGASFAHFSLLGAQCNVNAIFKIFHDYTFNEFYNFDSEKQERIVLDACLSEINFFSDKIPNSEISDFSATLLFIVTDRKRMIIGHIGDGIICALKNNDEVELLSGPDNIENDVNKTFFTINSNNRQFIKKFDNIIEYKAIFAMSDGLQKGFYNEIENRVLPVNLITIYDSILQSRYIELKLLSFLKQSFWENSITNDDCSMFIFYNDKESSDQTEVDKVNDVEESDLGEEKKYDANETDLNEIIDIRDKSNQESCDLIEEKKSQEYELELISFSENLVESSQDSSDLKLEKNIEIVEKNKDKRAFNLGLALLLLFSVLFGVFILILIILILIF